jgi:hypothetical protein
VHVEEFGVGKGRPLEQENGVALAGGDIVELAAADRYGVLGDLRGLSVSSCRAGGRGENHGSEEEPDHGQSSVCHALNSG